MKKILLFTVVIFSANAYACCCTGTIKSRVNSVKSHYSDVMSDNMKAIEQLLGNFERLNSQLLPDIASEYSSEELDSKQSLSKFNLDRTKNYYDANNVADYQQYLYQLKQIDEIEKLNKSDEVLIAAINHNVSSEFLRAQEAFYNSVKDITTKNSQIIEKALGLDTKSCLAELAGDEAEK